MNDELTVIVAGCVVVIGVALAAVFWEEIAWRISRLRRGSASDLDFFSDSRFGR